MNDAVVSITEKIFNQEFCHELARECKFIKRSSSKVKGYEFAQALILPRKDVAQDSLNTLCNQMVKFNPEAEMSPQALSKRLNSRASALFIKKIFERILKLCREDLVKSKMKNVEGALKHFPSVLIEDSTLVTLNKRLRKHFKGTFKGGKAGSSQMKINVIQEFRTGQVVDASIHSGATTDQSLAENILDIAVRGDLVIRDLGYFLLPCLQKMEENGVYYISRLPPHIKVFINEGDTESIDLAKYAKKHNSKKAPIVLEGFLGNLKVKTRIVLHRVPRKVYKKRLASAEAEAKRRRRRLSKQKKDLLKFTIFITNTPEDVLSAEVIGTLYRIRWEIELVFKRWKSHLKIDILNGINKNRIETIVWGRICTALLIDLTSKQLDSNAQKLGRELSHVKVIKHLLSDNNFFEAVRWGTLEKLLVEMSRKIERCFCKDRRKRKSMRKRVQVYEPFYDEAA